MLLCWGLIRGVFNRRKARQACFYIRKHEEDTVMLLFNFGDKPNSFELASYLEKPVMMSLF
jgi:hypothetical protein